MHIAFSVLFSFLGTVNLFSDIVGYAEFRSIVAESKNFIVIHIHDWTDATRDARYKMITTHQNPFTTQNTYAFFECIDKKTGNVLFKRHCPALTKIEISKDEKFIIGLSDIKLWNPYQFVLYSIKGELLKKRHITPQEAKLTQKQLDDFKNKFPAQYAYLYRKGCIFRASQSWYIDYMSTNMPDKQDKAWNHLYNYTTTNHLSTNFSGSVTNWIHWYDDKDPSFIFNYRGSELYSISLVDPKQKRFELKIKE